MGGANFPIMKRSNLLHLRQTRGSVHFEGGNAREVFSAIVTPGDELEFHAAMGAKRPVTFGNHHRMPQAGVGANVKLAAKREEFGGLYGAALRGKRSAHKVMVREQENEGKKITSPG